MLNINDVKNNLREVGYVASDKLAKSVALFEAAGRKVSNNIPAMLLEGPAGAGKTALAEAFATVVNAKLLFIQCYPGMGSDSFIAEPNISAIIKRDSQNSIKDGILVRSLKETTDGPTVVVIDELDKASPEVDAFLLDYLNSGRVSNGQDTWIKADGNIWVFITSNKQRALSDALVNRCRSVYVARPSKELFLDILGHKNDEGLAYIYDKCPTFSIRQAKQYLNDLKELGLDHHDPDVLSQYVNPAEIGIDEDTEEEVEEEVEYRYGVCKSMHVSSDAYKFFLKYISLNPKCDITLREGVDNYDEPCVYFIINSIDALIEMTLDICFDNAYDMISYFIENGNNYRNETGYPVDYYKLKISNKYVSSVYDKNDNMCVIQVHVNDVDHLFAAEKDGDDYVVYTSSNDIKSFLYDVNEDFEREGDEDNE